MADTAAEAPKEQTAKPIPRADIEIVPEPDIEAIRKEASASGYTEAAEIVELCELAGRLTMASGFVKQKASVAEVRKVLLATRAEQDKEAPTESRIRPDEGARPEKNEEQLEASTPERMRKTLAGRGLTKGGQ